MTGYNLEFIHPPDGGAEAFFNTTIASGNYPDLWNDEFKTYPGGPEGAMEDGILVNMNELIAEYAPNFNKRIDDGGEAIRKKIVTDSGTIIRFGTMFQCELTDGVVNRGFVMRKDILDKLNLSVPETTDEFLTVLRAIKKDGSVLTPLALPKAEDNIGWGTTYNGVNAISSAFGVTSREFFVRNNKVVYAPILPEYKDFLSYINILYSEGLLYEDFPNMNRSDTKKMFNGGQTATAALGNWELRTALALGQSDNPEYDIVPLPVLKKNKNDEKAHFNTQSESVNKRAWFLTSTCEYPVEAIKLVDLWNDPEVNRMFAWGLEVVEGNTIWVEKDGKRSFTDFIQNNPEYDFATQRDRYCLNPFQTQWDQDMEEQQYNHPINKKAWEIWGDSSDMRDLLPNSITPTVDEDRGIAKIMNAVITYTDEMFYQYVTGLKSLDTFDEYVSEVKSMDIDRALELYQAAYDRYLAR
jgi:putative aldouronate transport system substrate-binding protein